MWDALRGALVTSSIERESREDVLDIAAAELALMRVVDGVRAYHSLSPVRSSMARFRSGVTTL
jgi:hypothetical protein